MDSPIITAELLELACDVSSDSESSDANIVVVINSDGDSVVSSFVREVLLPSVVKCVKVGVGTGVGAGVGAGDGAGVTGSSPMSIGPTSSGKVASDAPG